MITLYVFIQFIFIFIKNVISESTFDTGYQYFAEEMSTSVSCDQLSVIDNCIIKQPLDHFDENETRTWSMRYFEYLYHWKPNGPIYLYMPGERPLTTFFFYHGLFLDLASDTDGAMFSAEHRYYGESMPLNVTDTTDLKYLSSRQALADAAKLLKKVKSKSKYASSKVVVIGGSYGGNLAAWMKLLYPELVTAAIASSAPVLAKVDFYEYLETVSDDYKLYGKSECMGEIEKAFKNYVDSFKTSDGIDLLKKEENICDDTDMTKTENQQLFFSQKIAPFMEIAESRTPDSIRGHCEDIINGEKKTNFNTGVKFWQKENNCYSYDFEKMIAQINKSSDQELSWTYQRCTEFGYYQTTSSKSHPFTDNVPIDFFYKQCAMLFGPEHNGESIKKAVENSNKFYQGLEINVTNVVFVNGDMDPWMRMSITNDISDTTPAIVIPKVSHCKDLYFNDDDDSDELRKARSDIKDLIKSWIGA